MRWSFFYLTLGTAALRRTVCEVLPIFVTGTIVLQVLLVPRLKVSKWPRTLRNKQYVPLRLIMRHIRPS